MARILHPGVQAIQSAVKKNGCWSTTKKVGEVIVPVVVSSVFAGWSLQAGMRFYLFIAVIIACITGFWIGRSIVGRLYAEWRYGWLGALPVSRIKIVLTLLVLTTFGLVLMSALALVICAAFVFAAWRTSDWQLTIGVLLASWWVSVGLAAVSVLVPSGHHRKFKTSTVRDEVLHLGCLDDEQLPHAWDWQRRNTIDRWRSGANPLLVAVILLAIPGTVSVIQGCGIFVVILALTWLNVALRVSEQTTASAIHLIAATPLDKACARKVFLRYPYFAIICVAAFALCGSLLVDHSWIMFCAWSVFASAISILRFGKIVRVVRCEHTWN